MSVHTHVVASILRTTLILRRLKSRRSMSPDSLHALGCYKLSKSYLCPCFPCDHASIRAVFGVHTKYGWAMHMYMYFQYCTTQALHPCCIMHTTLHPSHILLFSLPLSTLSPISSSPPSLPLSPSTLQTNIPIFKLKESSVRRRYRDFEWLKKELERDSKVCVSVNSCFCSSLVYSTISKIPVTMQLSCCGSIITTNMKHKLQAFTHNH